MSFLIQLYYYLVIYLRAAYKPIPAKVTEEVYPPVSVIICARNEAENLRKNLPFILNQDYPDFEVIVVNDCSEDESQEILEDFARDHKNLHISLIKKDPIFTHGKKLALTVGIKASTKNYLLLTDADCIPEGKDWIKMMGRNFTENKEIVLGIGLYLRRKGFLNLLIRFETAFTVMQYFGMARYGKPYMGVGRNLAYTKELFFRNKGFASHSHIVSGDDDLFIGETAFKINTALENHTQSFTWSEPKTTWGEWITQRKRHFTTGNLYQSTAKRLLATEYISRILLNVSFIFLLFSYAETEVLLLIYILQLIVKALCFNIVFRCLYGKLLFLPSLLIEPVIPFFYGYLHVVNHLDRKKNRWN